MYVSAISPRFSRGKSTPATRAICLSAFLVRAPASPALSCPGGGFGGGRRGPSEEKPPPTLPLTLLVPRVLADDARHAAPLDDLAVLAAHLHRRSHLHPIVLVLSSSSYRPRLCPSGGYAVATLPGEVSEGAVEAPPII